MNNGILDVFLKIKLLSKFQIGVRAAVIAQRDQSLIRTSLSFVPLRISSSTFESFKIMSSSSKASVGTDLISYPKLLEVFICNVDATETLLIDCRYDDS